MTGSVISMERHRHDGHNGSKAADHLTDAADPLDEPKEHRDPLDQDEPSRDDLIATAATVCVVGAGVIIFEAALLPGLVLGVATMLVPRYLPKIGAAVNPLVKSTVRGAYKMGQKTKEMVAEAQEHVHDIVAEVHAEGDQQATPKTRTTTASAA
jgi:Protein of unknown function (DUF5132)